MDLGSGIRKKIYSGSQKQGSKRHRIPDPQHWFSRNIKSESLLTGIFSNTHEKMKIPKIFRHFSTFFSFLANLWPLNIFLYILLALFSGKWWNVLRLFLCNVFWKNEHRLRESLPKLFFWTLGGNVAGAAGGGQSGPGRPYCCWRGPRHTDPGEVAAAWTKQKQSLT